MKSKKGYLGGNNNYRDSSRLSFFILLIDDSDSCSVK
jgi:hypothetical protein